MATRGSASLAAPSALSNDFRAVEEFPSCKDIVVYRTNPRGDFQEKMKKHVRNPGPLYLAPGGGVYARGPTLSSSK